MKRNSPSSETNILNTLATVQDNDATIILTLPEIVCDKVVCNFSVSLVVKYIRCNNVEIPYNINSISFSGYFNKWTG